LGIAVTPWVERSTIDLPLDGLPASRFAGVPGEAITAVKRLLDFLRTEIRQPRGDWLVR
jgi:hypothetical protein